MDIKHILVPYAGTFEDSALLPAACRIARAYRAKLTVVHVLEIPMTLPVDAEPAPGADQANEILDQAEDTARQSGVKACCELLQARGVGLAIVEEAADLGVDLIMMDAGQRARLGGESVGKAVDYVLKHAPCSVWISRAGGV